ncbi:hypothetical protein GQ53DRAFT_794145 [Thozetella sp. PMI_491]|nr:hypothetical protein GQ53DRAFT_794145 [Thozetella sp. PMI_491]
MERTQAHSAPYGQACQTCFKAKCRCIPRPDGPGCERCHRLHRQCCPSDSTRKRSTHRSHNGGPRIAQLESKIDGLVSLLQSVAGSTDAPAALRAALNHEVGGSPRSPSSAQVSVGNTAPGSGPSADASASNKEPLEEGLEAHLHLFRSRMLPCLPFIHLSPDVTAQQLRKDRPFLLHSIAAVTVPSTRQKLARGIEFKRLVTEAAMIENKSSIDLLLAVLVFAAWGYDQFLNRSCTVSRLMMLALSLVYDQRLNKPQPGDMHMVSALAPEFECSVEEEASGRHCLEQKRAVLGCFVLSTIIESYFAQMDTMRWTPWMEECLCTITANQECHSDEVLAFQVRMQRIAQRTMHVREQQQQQQHQHQNGQTSSVGAPIPAFLYLKALQGELQELKASMSPRLQQNQVILTHVSYVELCIHETAHPSSLSTSLLTTPAASYGGSMPGFERVECLWSSLQAAKAFTDVFTSLPPDTCIGLPFLSWAQYAACIVILYRLSTLEDPGWDCRAVRQTVDLLAVLSAMADRLELTSREAGEGAADDIFAQISGMTHMFRMWASVRLAPEEPSALVETGAAAGSGEWLADQEHLMPDFGNDRWLEELFTGASTMYR